MKANQTTVDSLTNRMSSGIFYKPISNQIDLKVDIDGIISQSIYRLKEYELAVIEST